MGLDLDPLVARLGHQFRDPDLLSRALTHKSRVHEHVGSPGVKASDNEQMEFLGDAILGFVVSDALVSRHPALPEGHLSKLKAHVVSAQYLSEAARALRLGDYLILGKGEELSGGRGKKALLANALEAVIAALYLDGGIDVARRFVLTHVVTHLEPVDEGTGMVDFKSALQEAAQAHKLPAPRYYTTDERGPEHAKTFTVEVRIGKEHVCSGEGLSKKAAGQDAAQRMLRRIKGQPD